MVKPRQRVLIVGGGTGYVLEVLDELGHEGLHIDYVEPSIAMIRLARKRNCVNLSVNFIQQALDGATLRETYDVLITQFFLDSFDGERFQAVLSALDCSLKEDGLWLVADFQVTSGWSKYWQQLTLNAMYLFFKFTVGIKATRLEDIPGEVMTLGYRPVLSRSFFSSFIFSTAYRKSEKK